MTEMYARTIVEHWKYGGQYSFHDYANEADHIYDSAGWGKALFAALDENGDLVGELTIEFYDQNDAPIEYADFNAEKLESAEMWIGFGLKPELTGRGLGVSFVRACLEFAVKWYDYKGEYVRLGAPAFNERAIKVYEKVGFEVFNRAAGEINGREFEAVQMRKPRF
ncbi:MAG: GNAT family N-acetyltransferase [Anaerolineales bacterium]|nr:GNAT family N-acetyltransferase [Anaerolineales bacterium]